MAKDSGPSKPAEAEDPGLAGLKQAAMDTYARQAATSRDTLAEQARSDQAISRLRAEVEAATGVAGPLPTVRSVPPTPALPPTSALRQVVLPRSSGQKLPVKGAKGKG